MYATSITTPLLIMHSENDLRCPVDQAGTCSSSAGCSSKRSSWSGSRRERQSSRARARRSHRVQRFELLIEWFDRYLKS